MVGENRFCVYVYKVKNIIRYVGHGTVLRPYSKSSRARAVLELFLEDSFEVVILHNNLTKEVAQNIENEYLDIYLNSPAQGWLLINKQPASKTLPITFEFANKYWYYDETSPSCLRWKEKRRSTLKDAVAGHKTKKGYYHITHRGKTYCAHRIIIVLHSRKEIENFKVVDHIDSDPSNNKITNLQVITQKQNMSKKKKSPKHMNVCWSERDKAYQAYFFKDGARISKYFTVSKYNSKEDAFEAAIAWKNQQIHGILQPCSQQEVL